MIKGRKMMLLFAVIGLASTSGVKAQDKVEASVGADLVSGYIWRGQDLGGASIQPAAGISYKGFSLSAWGSVGIGLLVLILLHVIRTIKMHTHLK